MKVLKEHCFIGSWDIVNVELKSEVDEHLFYFCFYENSVLEHQRAGLGN